MTPGKVDPVSLGEGKIHLKSRSGHTEVVVGDTEVFTCPRKGESSKLKWWLEEDSRGGGGAEQKQVDQVEREEGASVEW